MNRSHRNFIALGIVLLLCCWACGKPTQEIEATQKAIDQAKEQHPEEFAAKEWNDAQQAWTQAQAAIDAGNYSQATSLLLKARTRAEKARDLAKGKREELLKEVTGLEKTIDIRYSKLKTDLQVAKISPKAKKEIEDACKDIDQSIEKLKKQVDSGDLTPAKFTGQTTLRAVYEQQMALEGGAKK